jgi:Phosphodiester glycosidase
MVLAVNADAFSPWPAPFDQSTPTDLQGLAISDGTVVSRGAGTPSLLELKSGILQIAASTPDTDTKNLRLAVSGFGLCLDNGQPLVAGDDLHPRTGSHGATTQEVGKWLKHFGAHRGINMDGGGSTSLAWWDVNSSEDDKCQLLNRPVGNGAKAEELPESLFVPTERANGNNLGVVIDTPQTTHDPNLYLFIDDTYRGNKENNLILTGQRAAEQTQGALTNFDGYTILRDDREPNPNRRYKMIAHWESVHYWDNHPVSGSLGRPKELMDRYAAARGEYITYSPDGLRWEQALERLGNEMLIFFNAFSRNQQTPCPQGSRSIGVAKLRRDAFVGVRSSEKEVVGLITTKPLPVRGDRLLINIEQRASQSEGVGEVTVALLDQQGTELPGYGFADSIPLVTDSVRAPVQWKTKADLSELRDTKVRVAIRIRGGAIVYALAIHDEHNEQKLAKPSMPAC